VTRKRLVLIVVAALITGGILGGMCVAWLSARAGHLYVQMVRLSLAAKQRDSASAAWREGELADALTHAACAVEMEKWGREGTPATPKWDIIFPLMGLFSDEHTQYPVKDFSMLEAQAHARYGAVLERVGQTGGAQDEFAKAISAAGGKGSVEKWRALGLQELGPAQGAPTP